MKAEQKVKLSILKESKGLMSSNNSQKCFWVSGWNKTVAISNPEKMAILRFFLLDWGDTY